MALGFRKTVTFGGIGFTFSKSGITTSIGTRGLHLTSEPRSVYVTARAGGFSYRKRVDRGPRREPLQGERKVGEDAEDHSSVLDAPNDVEQSDFVEELDRTVNRGYLQILYALAAGVACYFLFVGELADIEKLEVATYLVFGLFVVRWIERRRRRFVLVYDLSENFRQASDEIQRTIMELGRSGIVRVVKSTLHHDDWKRSAGATRSIKLAPVRVGSALPRNVLSNFVPGVLEAQNKRLYFFPDRVLIETGRRYTSLSYDALTCERGDGLFVWEERLPGDAKVIRKTWKYVRRDGRRDRRFNNNYQIPIVAVAYITFSSNSGLNIPLLSTGLAAVAALHKTIQARKEAEGGTLAQGLPLDRQPAPIRAALEVLGFDQVPDRQHLRSAYVDLVGRNQPDRFYDAPPEVRELATNRLKEMNVAYADLVDAGLTEPVQSQSTSEGLMEVKEATASLPWTSALALAIPFALVFALFRTPLPINLLSEWMVATQKAQVVGAPPPAPARRSWVKADRSCNVRNVPSTSAKIVGAIGKGDELEVLAEKRGWRRIQAKNGVFGWLGPGC